MAVQQWGFSGSGDGAAALTFLHIPHGYSKGLHEQEANQPKTPYVPTLSIPVPISCTKSALDLWT